MKNKKGISLIILAITIIVMIIIAGAVIISITENDVIDEAKDSVQDWNTKAAKEQLDKLYQIKISCASNRVKE